MNTLIEHGQNPDAELLVWDPEMVDWQPVTGATFGEECVRLYTDEE